MDIGGEYMIKGFFWEGNRPYVLGVIYFPKFDIYDEIKFLIDTGADYTVISEKDAKRCGLDYEKLERAERDMGGIGGFTRTYFTEAVIKIEPDFITRRSIFIGKNYIPTDLPSNGQEELGKLFQRIPSLLGRDIIGQFGLFMHENTRRILLLKDTEIPGALFTY